MATDKKEKRFKLPSWKSVGCCTIVHYVDAIVAAVIIKEGKILCARRRSRDEYNGLWEIPGGEVIPGECKEFALIRICEEKLGIEVMVEKKFTSYRHSFGAEVLNYIYYEVSFDRGELFSDQYSELRWIPLEALDMEAFVPADHMVIPILKERRTDLTKEYP